MSMSQFNNLLNLFSYFFKNITSAVVKNVIFFKCKTPKIKQNVTGNIETNN